MRQKKRRGILENSEKESDDMTTNNKNINEEMLVRNIELAKGFLKIGKDKQKIRTPEMLKEQKNRELMTRQNKNLLQILTDENEPQNFDHFKKEKVKSKSNEDLTSKKEKKENLDISQFEEIFDLNSLKEQAWDDFVMTEISKMRDNLDSEKSKKFQKNCNSYFVCTKYRKFLKNFFPTKYKKILEKAKEISSKSSQNEQNDFIKITEQPESIKFPKIEKIRLDSYNFSPKPKKKNKNDKELLDKFIILFVLYVVSLVKLERSKKMKDFDIQNQAQECSNNLSRVSFVYSIILQKFRFVDISKEIDFFECFYFIMTKIACFVVSFLTFSNPQNNFLNKKSVFENEPSTYDDSIQNNKNNFHKSKSENCKMNEMVQKEILRLFKTSHFVTLNLDSKNFQKKRKKRKNKDSEDYNQIFVEENGSTNYEKKINSQSNSLESTSTEGEINSKKNNSDQKINKKNEFDSRVKYSSKNSPLLKVIYGNLRKKKKFTSFLNSNRNNIRSPLKKISKESKFNLSFIGLDSFRKNPFNIDENSHETENEFFITDNKNSQKEIPEIESEFQTNDYEKNSKFLISIQDE